MGDIVVKVDDREVMKALDKLDVKDANQTLIRGLKKAGNYLAGKARTEAPAHPRKLRSKLRARKARRDRPGIVVSAKHKLNPIIQEGTVQRHTKSGANRGRIKPNPFITRTADKYGDHAMDIAEDAIGKALDL
jgi:hypothetical protein